MVLLYIWHFMFHPPFSLSWCSMSDHLLLYNDNFSLSNKSVLQLSYSIHILDKHTITTTEESVYLLLISGTKWETMDNCVSLWTSHFNPLLTKLSDSLWIKGVSTQVQDPQCRDAMYCFHHKSCPLTTNMTATQSQLSEHRIGPQCWHYVMGKKALYNIMIQYPGKLHLKHKETYTYTVPLSFCIHLNIACIHRICIVKGLYFKPA